MDLLISFSNDLLESITTTVANSIHYNYIGVHSKSQFFTAYYGSKSILTKISEIRISLPKITSPSTH